MTANKTIAKIAHTGYVVAMEQVIGAVARHTFTGHGIDAADVPVWWSNGSAFVRPGYFVVDADGYAYRVSTALVKNI